MFHSSSLVTKAFTPHLDVMHTTLWATLTANGNYARGTAEHPPKPEALADFGREARAHGCFIVGRRTFEEFQRQAARRPPGAGGGGEDPLSGVTIVVVSRALVIPGLAVVRTPQEALTLLAERGHERALIAGGEAIHNAFLADGLVDRLALCIAPVLEDDGLKIVLPKGKHAEVLLEESGELGGGVVRHTYRLKRG